jgi:hypothetical protein
MANSKVIRASSELKQVLAKLDPLTDLIGRWVGSGFNLVLLPDKNDNVFTFRSLSNITTEALEYNPIGGLIPNRGLTEDLFFTGLNYVQQISDAETNGALHVETGQWLIIKEATNPNAPGTLVRQSTILHGNSLLAQGTITSKPGRPSFVKAVPTPTGPKVDARYIAHLEAPPLPDGFKPEYRRENMNQALEDMITEQEANNIRVTNHFELVVSAPITGLFKPQHCTQSAAPRPFPD